MTSIALCAVVNAVWLVVLWRMQRTWESKLQVVWLALEKAINDQMKEERMYIRRSSLWYIEQARKALESEAGDGPT